MDSLREARVRLLLRRYLDNECSASEMEELFLFIKQYPDDAIWKSLMENEAMPAQQDFAISEDMHSDLWQVLEKKLKATTGDQKTVQPKFTFSNILKVAAVLLVGVLCASALYYYRSTAQSEVIEQRTAFGERREIRLPDSSIVVLNGNSSIRYAADWSDLPERSVYLSGEGFFNVVHLAGDKKFQVHTNNGVTIEVLGTEFNVNDRRSRTQVVLQSGKIRLERGDLDQPRASILMNSGEYVEVKKESDTITRREVDSGIYTSWTNGRFVFKETPLRDILNLLEDNYGVVFRVDDTSVLNEKFTAVYPSDNIEVLVKALEKSFKVEVTRLQQTGYK